MRYFIRITNALIIIFFCIVINKQNNVKSFYYTSVEDYAIKESDEIEIPVFTSDNDPFFNYDYATYSIMYNNNTLSIDKIGSKFLKKVSGDISGYLYLIKFKIDLCDGIYKNVYLNISYMDSVTTSKIGNIYVKNSFKKEKIKCEYSNRMFYVKIDSPSKKYGYNDVLIDKYGTEICLDSCSINNYIIDYNQQIFYYFINTNFNYFYELNLSRGVKYDQSY